MSLTEEIEHIRNRQLTRYRSFGLASVANRPRHDAQILKDHYCKDCGWPVIFVCCNDEMAVAAPYALWDWWYYCSNKACGRHSGDGVFQNAPEWQHEVKDDGSGA
jgi:hypothetical protein